MAVRFLYASPYAHNAGILHTLQTNGGDMMQILKEGARGAEVGILQTALYRAGVGKVKKDGVFGAHTREAVMIFQAREGIQADGIVGITTWSRLEPYIKGYAVHTVLRGETLWQIAHNYNTTVNMLRTANPSVDPLDLRTGARITVPFLYEVVPTDIGYTYELVRMITEGLTARFPFLQAASAGKSTLGKELFVIRAGTGHREVFYNAAHHANEWITTVLLLKFLEDISMAYTGGERIMGIDARELFRNVSLYIMPLVNPDGVDIVTGAVTKGDAVYDDAARIASDYPQIPFPSGWKANIAGTDLNLNYPAKWEVARDIKYGQGYTTPAPRDYVGYEPLSAHESRAVYDFTLSHDFDLVIAYHTQGEEIYWTFDGEEPDGALKYGMEFERLSGYKLAQTPLESSYAGYKDWFISRFARPGFTVEAGRGENPLPITQFPKIYRDNFGILITGMKQL